MAHCGRWISFFCETRRRFSPTRPINKLPSISIVTPSYNQAAFLDETIRSVLGQKYDGLEYVVIDGGSSDGSVAVLERHAPSLSYWVSEPDGGQYDAIAKGFSKTSGEVMGWLNSDDQYTPWAFSIVGEIFARFPEIEWLTTLYPIWWDQSGRAVHCEPLRGFSRSSCSLGIELPPVFDDPHALRLEFGSKMSI